jgi:hypothetical protein
VWSSHEDYVLGHYLEAGIGYLESTGNRTLYDSALQAVDNMTSVFLGNSRAYAPGHEEIEQALTRLYGMTGDPKYLNLCGWLIAQRGCHEGRPNYGLYSQDQIPVKDQRTIEGHAVRAAFLFNGVTEYVGATGNPDYRQAVLAVWNDFEKRKMYVHGAGGTFSGNNEGYTTKPYYIPPNECYGETCSVFGNFQWAHNLFRLTGEARYLDTAERMLYNAFYASLALSGDRFFYENPAEVRHPTPRGEWHGCPCCPPNIVKLLAKVGFFFYSTDKDGIYVKQYGASSADIPFAKGVKLTQRTGYPWNGEITIQVDPAEVCRFALRLRLPAWAKSHSLVVNGKSLSCSPERGWLTVTRDWKAGDVVKFSLPMEIERVSMSEAFNEYKGLVACSAARSFTALKGRMSPRRCARSTFPLMPASRPSIARNFWAGSLYCRGTSVRPPPKAQRRSMPSLFHTACGTTAHRARCVSFCPSRKRGCPTERWNAPCGSPRRCWMKSAMARSPSTRLAMESADSLGGITREPRNGYSTIFPRPARFRMQRSIGSMTRGRVAVAYPRAGGCSTRWTANGNPFWVPMSSARSPTHSMPSPSLP